MSENTQAAGNTQTTSNAQTVVDAASGAGGTTPSAPASSENATTSQQEAKGQPASEPAKADAAGAEGDKGAEGEKPGAPEKYEFKAPEGKEFDPEVMSVYSTVAKELDLPQASAQKILDAIAPKVAERFAARQSEALENVKAEWAEKTRSDKEIGGEKLQENLAVAKKAMDAFGTPELRKLLNESGLGNHPDLVKAFYKVGKAISEDKIVPGGKAPSRGETNAAKALYPNQPA